MFLRAMVWERRVAVVPVELLDRDGVRGSQSSRGAPEVVAKCPTLKSDQDPFDLHFARAGASGTTGMSVVFETQVR